MVQPMVLEVQNVDQEFRSGFWLKRVQILYDVSLSVPAGSIFGFLGSNGAGKTTLIHLMVGLREPTRGRVRVAGVDATQPEARAKIGYLPERPYFYAHLTGEQLLQYFGTLSGLPKKAIHSRIPHVLSLVGMKDARHTELSKYSKGMLQRIGIAQAILHEPELLVLDEPMSGLDPLGRKEIRDLIRELAKQGHTVFFSTHVIPDVEAICDQVALIQKGRMIGCGPIGQFLAQGPVRTEVAFTELPDRALSAVKRGLSAPLESLPDGHRVTLSGQEEVSKFLRTLLDQGGRVLWVNPQRPSLEGLFEKERTPILASSGKRGASR